MMGEIFDQAPKKEKKTKKKSEGALAVQEKDQDLSISAAVKESAELKQQMQKMQTRLEQLEASQKAREQKVDEKISKVVESKQTMALPDSLKWAEKVKLSGDFRYRHETIEAENDGKPDRHRNRIRARLGLKAKVNDEWSLGFRLAGGSEDPVSTNQTLSGSFSSKGFWIDRAYFDYHPTAIENLHVVAGKMGNPFYGITFGIKNYLCLLRVRGCFEWAF